MSQIHDKMFLPLVATFHTEYSRFFQLFQVLFEVPLKMDLQTWIEDIN